MARDWLDILQEMEQWSRDLDRFMTHVNSRSQPMMSTMSAVTWSPDVNIYETADAVLVVAEVAGIAPEEINVKYEGTRLLVWGRRHELIPDGVLAVHRMEIELGPFAFLVELPGLVSGDGSEASLENGLLQISLPKRAAPESGTIPIRTVSRQAADTLAADTQATDTLPLE